MVSLDYQLGSREESPAEDCNYIYYSNNPLFVKKFLVEVPGVTNLLHLVLSDSLLSLYLYQILIKVKCYLGTFGSIRTTGSSAVILSLTSNPAPRNIEVISSVDNPARDANLDIACSE